MKGLLAALAMVGSISCSQPSTTAMDVRQPQLSFSQGLFTAKAVTSGEDRAECAANGGSVRRVGLHPGEFCVIAFADGGMPCISSSQCAGACLVSLDAGAGAGSNAGRCQANNATVGCVSEAGVQTGSPPICID